MLTIGANSASVDGNTVHPAAFRDHLVVRRANQALVTPGRPAPAAVAQVLAPGATPLPLILPYLQTRPDGLWMFASLAVHSHASRTLGVIPRYQHCARTFRLPESAPPITRYYPTWGALAAAVDQTRGTFEAAPW